VESRPFCDHRNNKASLQFFIYSLNRGGGKALSAARRFIIFRRIRRRITIHNNARDDDSDDDDAVYHGRCEYVVVSKPDSEDYQQRRDRESG
jgi:hypothetical protein